MLFFIISLSVLLLEKTQSLATLGKPELVISTAEFSSGFLNLLQVCFVAVQYLFWI